MTLSQLPRSASRPESIIETGRLVIDLDTHVALVEDRPVALTEKEYGIIELLSLRKGTILTKEMFLDHLYGGMDEPELKIIDVFVCKLRKKIAEATGGHHYIETVWGRGYVLRDPAAPWAAGASTLDENLAERIRAVLAGTGSVREVRMFGGLCFMLNGNMVAGASKRGLLVRVGKDQHTRALARPDAKRMEMSGRPMEGYVFIDPPPRDEQTLREWLDLAVGRDSRWPLSIRTVPAKAFFCPDRGFESRCLYQRKSGANLPSSAAGISWISTARPIPPVVLSAHGDGRDLA